MGEVKSEFRNTTGGMIGACVFDGRGNQDGVAVQPNATVWLSEEEQVATANGPRDPKNNPFVAGSGPGGKPALELVTEGRPIGSARNRPIGTPDKTEDEESRRDAKASARASRRGRSRRQSQETGAAEEPAGDPPEGEFGVGEEVGTPDAPVKT